MVPSSTAGPHIGTFGVLTVQANVTEPLAWLAHLHAALDRAVWAAYGWEGAPGETNDKAILARLLARNGTRAGR